MRAARRGVSMEEEARRILSAAGEEGPAQTNIADAIAGIMDPLGGVDLTVPMALAGADGQRSKSFGEHLASFPLTSEEWDEVAPTRSKISADPSNSPLSQKRILLVIGGGIAAYKSLDLIRRLRERGAGVRCILTKGAQQFVTPLAAASLGRVARPYRPVRPRGRGRHRPYPARPRRRRDHRRAGDGESDGEDRLRARRRPRLDRALGDDAADPDRAGDERAHVAAPGDAAQPRDADARRRRRRRAERRRHGRGRARPGPHGRAARDRGGAREAPRRKRGAPARRQARARHLRADARADRSGALHRQPLLRTPGPCHRGGGGGGRAPR